METAETVSRLVIWIKEQVKAAGANGVVLGMSGGLDSTLAAVLCQQACPGATLGLILPCYSPKEDKEHALMVARQFHIPARTIVLDRVFDTLIQLLPSQGFDPTTKKRAESNLKPRLRMLTLYYFANGMNRLVVGTSNKSELTVGYFSKHGDAGVDIMPLGNLVKRQIKELSAYLGIPREIIDKPPSASLWPGQTDEGELGLTYQELDSYLCNKKVSARTRERIEHFHAVSAHKRCLPPIPPF